MEGIGRIFEAYRDGVLEDDDEVAVDHAPAEFGYRQISEPMVNVRDAVRQACARGLIAKATAEGLIQAAKKMFYPERCWPAIAAEGRKLGLPQTEIALLLRFVREEKPNLKRDDGLELLRYIAGGTSATGRPHFEFEATSHWHAMREHLQSRTA